MTSSRLRAREDATGNEEKEIKYPELGKSWLTLSRPNMAWSIWSSLGFLMTINLTRIMTFNLTMTR